MIIINGILTESTNFNWLQDSGFKYGFGAFETILFYNNQAMYLDRHLSRLKNTLSRLNIPDKIIKRNIKSGIKKLSQHTQLSNGVIHIYITAGTTKISPKSPINPTEIITLTPLPKPPPIDSFEFKKVAPFEFFKFKSLNYAHHMIETQKSPHWIIYIDNNDMVIDSSIFSIGCIKKDTIMFPTHDYQLNSISRQIIIENILNPSPKRSSITSNSKHIKKFTFNTKPMTKKELLDSDAIFGSNVIRGIMALGHKQPPKQNGVISQLKNNWNQQFLV